jgi:hypothetical protein
MRNLRYATLTAVWLLTLPMAVHSAEPTWDEMQSLLGKPITDPMVKQFVEKNKLGQYAKFDSGGFDRFEKSAVSSLFRDDVINRIIIKVSSSESNQVVYAGKLLLDLDRNDSPQDVIRRLGKPNFQPENDYLVYQKEKYELTLVFDRKSHKLEEIYLDYVWPKIEALGLPYNKMDAKAIHATQERLAKKLNADLPDGWKATLQKGRIWMIDEKGAEKEVEADWYEIRVSYKEPIPMVYRMPPNMPRDPPESMLPSGKPDPFSILIEIQPKEAEQRQVTHYFEGCPFSIFDPREVRFALEDDKYEKPCDEVFAILEKTLKKQEKTTQSPGK